MSMFYDLLMAQVQARKGDGPIWCEYLESNGKQVLGSLPIHYNPAKDKYKLTFSVGDLSTVPSLFIISDTGNSFIDYIADINGSFYHRILGINGGNVWTDFPKITAGKHTMTVLPGKNLLDDVSKDVEVGIDKESSFEVQLFPELKEVPYKVYSFQFYKENKLVMNLRPCLHPSTLRPAMYDTIGKKYYYNQGNGEFNYSCRSTWCEYIESTGTDVNQQYIDTGVIPDQDTSVCITLSNLFFNGDKEFNVLYTADNRQTGARYGTFLHDNKGGPLDGQVHYGGTYNNFLAPTPVGTDVLIFKQEGPHIYVDGEQVLDFYSTHFQCKESLIIFGDNQYGSWKPPIAKLYSVQMYDKGGMLLVDLSPCLHPDTLEPCMYDIVKGEYHLNQGTIPFKYKVK